MSFPEPKGHVPIALAAALIPVYRSFAAAEVPLLLLEAQIVIGLMLLIAAIPVLILHKTGPGMRLLVLTLILFISLDLAGVYVGPFEAFRLDDRIPENTRILAKGLILLLILTALYAGLRLIRRHAVKIVAIYFIVVALAVIAIEPLPTLTSKTAADSPAAVNDTGDPKPPLVIHLLFDGMLAPGAIDPGIRGGKAVYRAMQRLAEPHGFRVFERAYSRHHATVTSIPNMMNAEYTGENRVPILEEKHTALKENAYFDDYAARGYAIRVYQQSKHLDYCANENVAVCNSYSPAWSIVDSVRKGAATGVFSTSTERALGLLSLVLCEHDYNYSGCLLARLIRESPAGRTLIREETFKAISLIRFRQTGFTGWFDNFVEDLMRSERGTLFFAHFLVPHDPFLLAEDCGLLWRWEKYDHLADKDPGDPDAMIQKRKLTLESYYDQVRCALLKVEELLARIDRSQRHRDALIILHGDHGSRISTGLETDKTRTGFVTRYATFFAVRAPGRSRAGHDCEAASLPDLFTRYAGRAKGDTMGKTPRHGTIITMEKGVPVARAMPEFPCFHQGNP